MGGAILDSVPAALTIDAFLRRCGWWRSQDGDWLAADPCVYCLRRAPEVEMSLEHVTPVSHLRRQNHAWPWGRGWPPTDREPWENHARACRDCNSARSNLPFVIYLLRRRAGLPSTHWSFRRDALHADREAARAVPALTYQPFADRLAALVPAAPPTDPA